MIRKIYICIVIIAVVWALLFVVQANERYNIANARFEVIQKRHAQVMAAISLYYEEEIIASPDKKTGLTIIVLRNPEEKKNLKSAIARAGVEHEIVFDDKTTGASKSH